MVVTDRGVIVRTEVSQIATLKRATQGVILIRLKNDQKVSTIAVVPHQDEDIEEVKEETFEHPKLEGLDVETKNTVLVDTFEPEEEEISENIIENELL
jgi:DNA gyrase subunit A